VKQGVRIDNPIRLLLERARELIDTNLSMVCGAFTG
jgi:hypothetical protein